MRFFIFVIFSLSFLSCVQEKQPPISQNNAQKVAPNKGYQSTQTTSKTQASSNSYNPADASQNAKEIYWDEVRSMKKIGGLTRWNISTINDQNVTAAATKNQPVVVNTKDINVAGAVSNVLNIKGWAYDQRSNRPAKDVYICIGGRLFDTDYGKNSEWMVREFNPNLGRCGFEVNLKSHRLEKGMHEMYLIVVTQDGFFMHHPTMVEYGTKLNLSLR